jgi:4-amino-4-deoxychorismate lyase
VILIDGKPTDQISVLDRGFTYGDGVFRTMKVSAGRVLCWERHWRKLGSDCLALGLTIPQRHLIEQDRDRAAGGLAAGVLKIIVTRGVGGRGYDPALASGGTRVIMSFPARSDSTTTPRDGLCARWCRTRVSVQPALAGVKHLGRLENILARAEWSAPEIDEGLMLDPDGHVIEGTASNLFLIENERLVTPDLTRCGVAGVQRERVLEVADRLGIECVIQAMSVEQVLAANAVFLVNSLIGIQPVTRIEQRIYPQSALVNRLALELDGLDD